MAGPEAGLGVNAMRMLAFIVALTTISFAQAPATTLPPPVKSAFEKAYPGATISAATQERESNRTLFRIDSTQNGKRRVVLYDVNRSEERRVGKECRSRWSREH